MHRNINAALQKFVQPARLQKINQVLSLRKNNVRLVFDQLSDPFNAFACYRTCDLLGIQYVDMIPSKDVRVQKNLIEKKTSKSADSWITVTDYTDASSCVKYLKSNGFKIWASDLSPGAISLESIALESQKTQQNGKNISHWITESEKVALVFGNEHTGISNEIRQIAEFYIPMHGFVQSFNVGVSVALTLYHLQHVVGLIKPSGNLQGEEKERIMSQFLLKNCSGVGGGNITKILEILNREGVQCTAKEIEDLLK